MGFPFGGMARETGRTTGEFTIQGQADAIHQTEAECRFDSLALSIFDTMGKAVKGNHLGSGGDTCRS